MNWERFMLWLLCVSKKNLYLERNCFYISSERIICKSVEGDEKLNFFLFLRTVIYTSSVSSVFAVLSRAVVLFKVSNTDPVPSVLVPNLLHCSLKRHHEPYEFWSFLCTMHYALCTLHHDNKHLPLCSVELLSLTISSFKLTAPHYFSQALQHKHNFFLKKSVWM